MSCIFYNFDAALVVEINAHRFILSGRDVIVLCVQGRGSFYDTQNFLSQNRAPCEDDFETIKLIINGAYGWV